MLGNTGQWRIRPRTVKHNTVTDQLCGGRNTGYHPRHRSGPTLLFVAFCVFQLESDCRERRQADHQGMGAALPWEIFRFESTHVADIGAAVSLGVGVDNFAVEPRAWDTKPITVSDHRGRVHGEDNDVAIARSAHESDYAVFRIVEINPLKSFMTVVAIPQGRLVLVNVIEMLDESAEPIMFRQIQELPIQLPVVIPFPALTKFSAHEEQFFARMSVHPGEKHPKIRELLPFVAR